MGNIKLISSIVLFILGILLFRDFFWAGILSFLGYIISVKIIKNSKIKYKEKFENQLVDAIQMLSGYVKSGLNLVQSIENVQKNIGPPLSVYFGDILKQIKLGVPFETALTEISEKVKSKEFSFAVLTVKIAYKYGGNFSENLKRISNTLRERRRIQNKIKALTSQGRISAKMITITPFVLLLILNFLEPEIFGIMFRTTFGKLILLFCFLLCSIGNWAISKIIEIDI
jgi:tight adherence protein B